MHGRKQGQMFSYLVILWYLVFLVLPVLWLVSTSIKSPLEAFAIPPTLIVWPKLKNFVEVLANKTFMLSLLNSLLVALGTVTFTMLVSIPAAYGLGQNERLFQKQRVELGYC